MQHTNLCKSSLFHLHELRVYLDGVLLVLVIFIVEFNVLVYSQLLSFIGDHSQGLGVSSIEFQYEVIGILSAEARMERSSFKQ